MNNDVYKELPEDLAAALRRCDLLIGKEQLEYFYNLYDPETGGFYYSISSRDSEEMTPFAEGTLSARRSHSGALWIRPSSSRSHWMVLPALNTLPSNA